MDFQIKDHTNLKGEVIIPNGVKEIHRNAFLNCQNIKKIFVFSPPRKSCKNRLKNFISLYKHFQ